MYIKKNFIDTPYVLIYWIADYLEHREKYYKTEDELKKDVDGLLNNKPIITGDYDQDFVLPIRFLATKQIIEAYDLEK